MSDVKLISEFPFAPCFMLKFVTCFHVEEQIHKAELQNHNGKKTRDTNRYNNFLKTSDVFARTHSEGLGAKISSHAVKDVVSLWPLLL